MFVVVAVGVGIGGVAVVVCLLLLLLIVGCCCCCCSRSLFYQFVRVAGKLSKKYTNSDYYFGSHKLS